MSPIDTQDTTELFHTIHEGTMSCHSSTSSWSKASYESIDGKPTTRQELAAAVPARD
jgi:hypothetical protein